MTQPELKAAETSRRNTLKETKPYVYEKIMKFEEKIKKGESIAMLQFQYDYTCNFRCEHCCITKLRRPAGDRAFTPADVKELARQADEMGLAQIVLTGGEPLVFPDFDEIIKAIDPQKFYIVSDSNGWFLDEAKAKHLKDIGVDKVQLSLDSLDSQAHDDFRKRPGAYQNALRAIEACQKVGLYIIVQTVVTKQRLKSEEFKDFLKFLNQKGVPVFVTYAKPVGDWEGNFEAMVDKDDMNYMRGLEKECDAFTHLTPSYGMDLGCIAVKRMISITKYGDVMPCPYMHVSLGNFFKEPLKDIIERGLNIKYFGQYYESCYMAEDKDFINKYIVPKVYGKPLPVSYNEVFNEEDYIKPEERKLYRD
ncbi:MAG: radical SAM protein [Patescibacteria group bacterium]